MVRAADDETFKETEMWLKNLGADGETVVVRMLVMDGGSPSPGTLQFRFLDLSCSRAEVLPDQGSLSRELETRRFFARPKVAFDSVGGHSAMRIADALAEGGTIMIYGCSSGKAPTWTWQQWVFKRLKAEGFNIRRRACHAQAKVLSRGSTPRRCVGAEGFRPRQGLRVKHGKGSGRPMARAWVGHKAVIPVCQHAPAETRTRCCRHAGG